MSIRWLNDDFTDPDIVATFSASSAQAAFPVTNIQTERRSKVWRSNGYYVVPANTRIVFQETAATNLYATIASGTYTSFSSLAAAIKTALEGAAAANSTYTITKDTTTQKMQIASDGAGGGGIFSIIWTDADSATAASLFGWDTGSDDTGSLSYIGDNIAHATEEFLLWDFGISTNIDAFVLIGNRNSAIKFSPTAVVKLEANETDNFTSPSFSSTLTLNDFVISKFASTDGGGIASQQYRYWRVEIVDNDNSNGYIEIGQVFLGNWYETVQGQAQFGAGFAPSDRSRVVFSEGGQTFGDELQKSEQFSIKYNHLTVTEKDKFDEIFDKFGITKPFFVVLDPSVVFYTQLSDSIRYVKFEKPPTFSLERPGLYSMAATLREEL